MSNLSSIYGEEEGVSTITHTSTLQDQSFPPPLPDQALPEQEAPLLSREALTDTDGSQASGKCRQLLGALCGVFITELRSFQEASGLLQGTAKLWVLRQGFGIHWLAVIASITNAIGCYGKGIGPGALFATGYCILVLYLGFYCVFNPIFQSLKTDASIGWVTSLFFWGHFLLALLMFVGLPPNVGFLGIASFDGEDKLLATFEVITLILWGVVLCWSVYFWKSAREV